MDIKKTTITDLQHELFISRPSVYKDLEKAGAWLKEKEISIIHDKKKGIYLAGGEKRIRKALYDLFILSEDYDEMVDLLENKGTSEETSFNALNYFSYCQKEDILSVDYNTVNNIVRKMEEAFKIQLTSADLRSLTIKYVLAISRMLEGYFVDMKVSTMNELMDMQKYTYMEIVKTCIEDEFDLILPEEEIGYLFGITIVSKTHFNDANWNVNEKMMVISKIVAQEIVDLIKESYLISDELTLYNGLMHHLKSVSNKIKLGLDFYNPIIEEVKKNYPEEFNIASRSKNIFEEYFHYDIPEDEVAYIALHIAAAVERSKKPLKAYVVYHSSYTEIMLILELLKNNFNQLDIQQVIPATMLKHVEEDDIDLMISIRELDEEYGTESIVLPAVLTEEDVQKFSILLRKIYEERNHLILRKIHS